MRIADFSIKHPAIIGILLIAVLLFGGLSLRGLEKDFMADTSLPTVIVFTQYPGVSPEVIERDITEVLEDELTTLPGLSSMSSVSEDSASVITLEFDWSVDIDTKIADIREKINNVSSDLPEEISGPPAIFRMNSSAIPIYTAAVESSMEIDTLTRFIEEEVVPSLSRITGVSEIQLQGGRENIVDIEVDLSRLEARNIAVLDVYQLLRQYNTSYPSGNVELHNNELQVRTTGEYASLEEIRNTVIGYRNNTTIRLEDIAEVTLTERTPDTYVSSGSDDIIIIDVMKQQAGDTQEIVAAVEEQLAAIEQDHPGSISFNTIINQSRDIDLAINSVRSAAITGGILAVFILFVFLHRLRTTSIVGISIPLSIVIAFIAMNLQGMTLNLMSLGGLTVAIGMMVDSSIVVLENIHRHYHHNGDRFRAVSLGTDEVGGAIVASTTTSLCVFIPLLFVQGLAGIILEDGAYTIIFALTASLAVAVIVVPFLASLLLKERGQMFRPGVYHRLEQAIDTFLERLVTVYKRGLQAALHNRVFVILVAVAVLGVSVLATEFLGFSFIPSTDMNEILIDIETPGGYSVEESKAKVEELHGFIIEKVPELDTALYYIGQGGALGLSQSSSLSFGRLRLIEKEERQRSVFEIMNSLQEQIQANILDADVTLTNGGLDYYLGAATGGQGFIIQLYGENMDKLIQASEMVENIMKQDPDVTKTDMNVRFNRQEIVNDLALDYMGNLGIPPSEAGITSRIIFNGMDVGTYRTEEKSYEMFLNSTISGAAITDDILNRISVRSQSGKLVSFAGFSELETQSTVSSIHHQDKMKSIRVTGYLRGADVRGTSERVTSRIEELSFPVGVEWEIAGSTAEMVSSFTSLIVTMLIAVFLVYMVMVIQFERFTQPLIVMAAVPFTFIGVIAGLLLFGSTLSIVSFMGIIALGGIVVNNAIVMIHYINLLRDRDRMGLVEALLEGGSTRLRPILMTTLTTVLGVLPMAFGVGEGAAVYAPLGQSIAGGLITSTLITLFLVPTLYYSIELRIEKMKQIRTDKNQGGET